MIRISEKLRRAGAAPRSDPWKNQSLTVLGLDSLVGARLLPGARQRPPGGRPCASTQSYGLATARVGRVSPC